MHHYGAQHRPEQVEQRDEHACHDARHLSVGAQRRQQVAEGVEGQRHRTHRQQPQEERVRIDAHANLRRTVNSTHTGQQNALSEQHKCAGPVRTMK